MLNKEVLNCPKRLHDDLPAHNLIPVLYSKSKKWLHLEKSDLFDLFSEQVEPVPRSDELLGCHSLLELEDVGEFVPGEVELAWVGDFYALFWGGDREWAGLRCLGVVMLVKDVLLV